MHHQPSDNKVCAKIIKLRAKRLFTVFPLKDVIAVLDQDQSGLQKTVVAHGGALKISCLGPRWAPNRPAKRPHFNNQYAGCGQVFNPSVKTRYPGATFISCLKTLIYTYALASMSEPEERQFLTKRCHFELSVFHRVTRRLHEVSDD